MPYSESLDNVKAVEVMEKELHCEYLHEQILNLGSKHKKYSMATKLGALACLYYLLHHDPNCPPIHKRSFVKMANLLQYDSWNCLDPNSKLLLKHFNRFYKHLVNNEKMPLQKCTMRPTIYVKDALNKLGVPENVKILGYDLCIYVVRNGLHSGHVPHTIASAIVYLACRKAGLHKTQHEIASLMGSSQVALGNAVQMLLEKHSYQAPLDYSLSEEEANLWEKIKNQNKSGLGFVIVDKTGKIRSAEKVEGD